MEKAEMKVGENWKEVYAKDMSEKDRHAKFRCCVCHMDAHLALPKEGIENYFFSNNHLDDCYMAEGGKTFITREGVKYKVDDLLRAKDKPIPEGGKGDGEPGPKPGTGEPHPKEELPVDNKTKKAQTEVKSCSSFYRNMRASETTDFIKEEVMTVGDTIVDYRTIGESRRKTLSGVKLVIGTKCRPPFKLPKEYRGYVVVRDPYIKKGEEAKANYYLLKCEEPSNDKAFKNKFYDKKNKYCAAFGRIKDAKIEGYKVYEMQPLAKARFCFLTENEIDWCKKDDIFS